MSQVLGAACPSVCGGENSHPSAALRALWLKYRLGPDDVSLAAVTFPDESTSTRAVILIVPVIVFFALCGMSGSTWWTTSPPDAGVFLGDATGWRAGGAGRGAV